MRKRIRSRFALGLLGLALVVVAGLVAAGVSSSGASSIKAGVGLVAKSGDPDANVGQELWRESPMRDQTRPSPRRRRPSGHTRPTRFPFARRDGNFDLDVRRLAEGRGRRKLAVDRTEPGAVPGRARPVPRGRQAVHRVRPRHGAGDRGLQGRNGGRCSLYLGAAGGGVWVADRGDDGEGNVHWQFKSGSFATNAIGSLLVDPSDPNGNTVYAGTGEPNASGDSEAGMGIYKSTDGGDSWTLVPAAASSGIARSRSMVPSTVPATCSSASPARSAASARSPAARSAVQRPAARGRPRHLPPDRHFDVHAALAGRLRSRHERGRRRPEQLERALRGVVPGGRLALAEQRRHVDADQGAAERCSEHRPG